MIVVIRSTEPERRSAVFLIRLNSGNLPKYFCETEHQICNLVESALCHSMQFGC